MYNDAAYVSVSDGSNQAELPAHPHDIAVMGGDGDSIQKMVWEQVGDGDKDIFCGAVMGSSTCPRIIHCYAA